MACPDLQQYLKQCIALEQVEFQFQHFDKGETALPALTELHQTFIDELNAAQLDALQINKNFNEYLRYLAQTFFDRLHEIDYLDIESLEGQSLLRAATRLVTCQRLFREFHYDKASQQWQRENIAPYQLIDALQNVLIDISFDDMQKLYLLSEAVTINNNIDTTQHQSLSMLESIKYAAFSNMAGDLIANLTTLLRNKDFKQRSVRQVRHDCLQALLEFIPSEQDFDPAQANFSQFTWGVLIAQRIKGLICELAQEDVQLKRAFCDTVLDLLEENRHRIPHHYFRNYDFFMEYLEEFILEGHEAEIAFQLTQARDKVIDQLQDLELNAPCNAEQLEVLMDQQLAKVRKKILRREISATTISQQRDAILAKRDNDAVKTQQEIQMEIQRLREKYQDELSIQHDFDIHGLDLAHSFMPNTYVNIKMFQQQIAQFHKFIASELKPSNHRAARELSNNVVQIYNSTQTELDVITRNEDLYHVIAAKRWQLSKVVDKYCQQERYQDPRTALQKFFYYVFFGWALEKYKINRINKTLKTHTSFFANPKVYLDNHPTRATKAQRYRV